MSDWDHANSVYTADIDLDGDVDLLGTASGRTTGNGEIAWFENDGSQDFTKHSILNTAARPSCVIALDIDFDLDAREFDSGDRTWGSGIGSKTLWPFYGVSLLATLFVMFLMEALNG